MPHSFVVYSNPAEGREDEYNRWYDDIHLGEVLAIPGFTAARRFRVTPIGPDAPKHHYLAIYEISAEDPGPVLADLMGRAEAGGLRMSDALGEVQTVLYEQIASREA